MKTRTNVTVLSLLRCTLVAAAAACSYTCPTPAQPGKVLAQKIVAESEFQGGLIVLVGGRDVELAISLGSAPNVLVHWLVRDRAGLEAARGQIRDAGVYGRVSAMAWEGPRLPYADDMVNLLILQTDGGQEIGQAEVNRVLAPLGAQTLFRDGVRVGPFSRKSWPQDVDEWTHSRHDATGNAVSKDRRAGHPRFIQWEALPRWNRGTKTSAMVSAQGRIFYILDDSHFLSTTRTWSLIARDAYNGILLWRRELGSWVGAKHGKKVGPAQVNRRLVALGDQVCALLGDEMPISVLDAATGEVIRTLEITAKAEEFLVSEGILVALVNTGDTADFWRSVSRDIRIVAVRPDTGRLLWEHEASAVLPMTLTADEEQVVYHDGEAIRSLDLQTGAPRWRSPFTGQAIVLRDNWNPDSPGAERSKIILAPQLAPTLVIFGDVVAFAGGRQLNVISARDGRELWRAPYAATNYSVPVDLFGFDGAIWGPEAGMNLWRPTNDDVSFKAYDPLTGAVKKTVSGKYDFRFQHHRCHQMKVIGSTVVAARAGIEFLDTVTGDVTAHHWVRGSCYFGVMPANGLLYVPPHDCACYVRAKLSGFMALNALRSPVGAHPISEGQRLRRGPAYGQTTGNATPPGADDWPTYRQNAARSGTTTNKVGPELRIDWQTELGEKLTSPVVACGRVFLASADEHILYALRAETGERLWEHGFDGRIDSPPTVYEGLVLTGCRDGSVAALRVTDGSLVWRFLGAPEKRMIVSRGQLESVWPVHGSVLVVNNTVYFAAGRSSYLDGGLRLYGLEPHTGRKIIEEVLDTRQEDGSQTLDEQAVDGFLNDILSSDGERLFMRHQILGMAGKPQAGRRTHLHSPDGYLSSNTTSRLIWTYAPLYTSPHQGAFYDIRLSRMLFPSGRILVEDDHTIYGFGQNYYSEMRSDPGGTFALFASPKRSDLPLDLTAKEYRKLALAGKHQVRFNWWRQIPIHVWAMVKTEDLLFVAGPNGSSSVSQNALEGKAPGALLVVSPANGATLNEVSLPSMPVWDGMLAAADSLYIALADGSMVRLSTPRRLPTP